MTPRRRKTSSTTKDDEEPPIPTSFYDVRDRIGKWRSKEKHKVKKCRVGNGNEPNNGHGLVTLLRYFEASGRSSYGANNSQSMYLLTRLLASQPVAPENDEQQSTTMTMRSTR
jgi:hypothetical protein